MDKLDGWVEFLFYSYPPAACFGRRMVLPKMSMRELNEKLSIISRVVVHPKYRTIGLGHKLIRETLEHVGTPYVEAVAVMAKYNPFFEKAGMRKIAQSQPVKEAYKVAELLKTLGFNTTFLRSQKIRAQQTLKTEQARAEHAKDDLLREQASAFYERVQFSRSVWQKQVLRRGS